MPVTPSKRRLLPGAEVAKAHVVALAAPGPSGAEQEAPERKRLATRADRSLGSAAPCSLGAARPAAGLPSHASLPPCLDAPAAWASDASVGEAKDLRYGRQQLRLVWDGRWGKWGGVDSVLLCAPLVALFDAVLTSEVSAAEVVEELRTALSRELEEEPPSKMLVAAHEVDAERVADARRSCIKVAIVWKKNRCKKLAAAWQARKLCGGKASITWSSTRDTAEAEHVELVKSEDSSKVQSTSVSLQLPKAWAFRTLPVGTSVALPASSHWHRFAAIFGAVESAEFLWGQAASVVQLVVRYRSVCEAKKFVEMVSCRYLWNPALHGDGRSGMGYPIVYVADTVSALRARVEVLGQRLAELPLPLAPAGGALGPIYHLERLNSGPTAQSPCLKVAPWRDRAVIGREDTCDLVIRSHHMSRQHAVLQMREAAQTGELVTSRCLYIQDKSTNGVWVNGRRVERESFVPLRDRDRVAFEADGIRDVPTYLVRCFRSLTHMTDEGVALMA